VKFIQHQELETLGIADHLLIQRILLAEDVLQHHVVHEKDVWRIVLDLLPLFFALLACVTRKSDARSLWIALT
jgi:hypothetical protein